MKIAIIQIITCLILGSLFGWFFCLEYKKDNAKKQEKLICYPDNKTWYFIGILDGLVIDKKEDTETTWKLYKDYPGNIKMYQAKWDNGALRIIQ